MRQIRMPDGGEGKHRLGRDQQLRIVCHFGFKLAQEQQGELGGDAADWLGCVSHRSDPWNQLLPFFAIATPAQGLKIEVFRIPAATKRHDVIDLKVSGAAAPPAPPAVANQHQRSSLVAQRSALNPLSCLCTLKTGKSDKVGELRHLDWFGRADQRSELCGAVWQQIAHPRSEQQQADQMSLLRVGKTAEALVVQ